jgi:hypothetical protein
MAKTARRPRSGRSTRKAGHGPAVTVESLQASFELIDKKIRGSIERGKTDSSVLEQLKRTWNEHFHMTLSPAALRGLMMHYRATSKRTTRKAGKQRGGMAPLDHMMGQGITGAVYGRFPVEIGQSEHAMRGLDLTRFYENPISRSCNATGGFDAPRQSGGSHRQTVGSRKQTGGGVFDAIGMGHMPASVPHNRLETTVSAIQGHTIADPSASPVAASVATVNALLQPFDTSQVSQITSLAPIFKGF